MNDYRSTVNLPGQPRNTVASWPESPRTAVLVGAGILIPAKRAITEPLPSVPAAPPLDAPAGLAASGGDAPPLWAERRPAGI